MKKSRSANLGTRRLDEDQIGVIRATYLIRKLQGKSGSVLALCEDDQYYVIKFEGSPKGSNALANEILGCQLAAELYIKVPAFTFVEISSALIRSAPMAWFADYADGLRPLPGLHFATRFIGTPIDPFTSDFIPRRGFRFLANRDQFLGILILDIWANNQKPRQAVFDRDGFHRVAHFVDCGSMFGGPECNICDDDFVGFFFDIEIYKDIIDKEQVDRWITRLQSAAPRVLSMTFEQIPRSWYTASFCHARKLLADRLHNLADRVYPVLERLRE